MVNPAALLEAAEDVATLLQGLEELIREAQIQS